MLSTKVYKRVHTLAEGLIKAAHKENTELFATFYSELRELCEEHEASEKNHAVQWEALADFTEESDEAFVLYEKALKIAEQDQAHDYIASINYAVAVLYQDLGQNEQALSAANKADEQAGNITDEELKAEVTALIEALQPPAPEPPHPIYG